MKRSIKWGLAITGIAALGLIYTWAHRARPLLSLAQMVPGIEYDDKHFAGYCWQDSRHVLLFQTEAELNDLIDGLQADFKIDGIDTVTGVHSMLPVALHSTVSYEVRRGARSSAWVSPMFNLLASSTRCGAVSPDGKWLLWSGGGTPKYGAAGTQVPGLHIAVELANGRQMTVPTRREMSEITDGVWLPDSRRWVEQMNQNGKSELHLHDVSRPEFKQEIQLPTSEPELSGAMPNGHLLWLTLPNPILSSAITDVTLEEIDLFAPELKTHRYKITLPTDRRYLGAVLSPQCDRIAWNLYIEPTQPAFRPLRQLYRLLHIGQISANETWVSDRDGTNMHLIGYVNTDHLNQPPSSVEWTPDGKRLSFLFQNRLYTVAVD